MQWEQENGSTMGILNSSSLHSLKYIYKIVKNKNNLGMNEIKIIHFSLILLLLDVILINIGAVVRSSLQKFEGLIEKAHLSLPSAQVLRKKVQS